MNDPLGMMHSTVLLKYSIRDYFSCRFLCKQMREFWSIFIFKWKFKWHYAKITTTELYLLMLSILIHLTIFIFEMMQKRILRPPLSPFFDAENVLFTGKSFSEALLFVEHGENMLCTKIVLSVRNHFCTQYVLPMFYKKKSVWQRFTCNSNSFYLEKQVV